ncbi:MAG: putative RNA methyltransferase [Euzebya sp.]
MSLDAAVDLLACPICGGAVLMDEEALACAVGHRFDVARQGYVTLTRQAIRHPGDTAVMVQARDRVQRTAVLAPVAQAVTEAVPTAVRTLVDVGAGTGYYSSQVLAAFPECRGIAVDSSKPVLRRAARAHPRLAAVGCDIVAALPVADGVIDLVLVVFAPRNWVEFDRMLTPDGVVLVVTPEPGHLTELAAPMGLLAIGEGKSAQLAQDVAGRFGVTSRTRVTYEVSVGPQQIVDLALMGPAGFHATPEELQVRAQAMADQCVVTMDVTVTTLQRAAD